MVWLVALSSGLGLGLIVSSSFANLVQSRDETPPMDPPPRDKSPAPPAKTSPKTGGGPIFDCLESAGVPYNEPGTADYSRDAAPFNGRLPYTPAAVAVPTTLDQIRAAVLCGAETGLKVSAKCGGHSYASLGLGGEDGHLVLELDRMDGVTLHDDLTATIQGGARLGHVAEELWEQGGRAISHGTCPGVGIGGHALHGGFGMSSYTHGLALDWISEVTVVLANGTVAVASEEQNPDLFWAMRGAGSSFGVLAEMKVNTFVPGDDYSHFEVQLNWTTPDEMEKGWADLQDWGQNDMPREMNMRLGVDSRGVHLDGLYAGTWDEMLEVLEPLVDRLGGGNFTVEVETDWMGQLETYAYGTPLDQTHPYNMHETFYSTSLATKALPADAIRAFVNYTLIEGARTDLNPQMTEDGEFTGNRFWWILVDIHGGSNSYIVEDADPNNMSSYAHRDKLLLWQFYDRMFEGDYPADGFGFLQNYMKTITDHMDDSEWGMYINYADSQLSQEEAMEYYWRESLPRLRQIKKAVDVDEVFYNPLGVRPDGL